MREEQLYSQKIIIFVLFTVDAFLSDILHNIYDINDIPYYCD